MHSKITTLDKRVEEVRRQIFITFMDWAVTRNTMLKNKK